VSWDNNRMNLVKVELVDTALKRMDYIIMVEWSGTAIEWIDLICKVRWLLGTRNGLVLERVDRVIPWLYY